MCLLQQAKARARGAADVEETPRSRHKHWSGVEGEAGNTKGTKARRRKLTQMPFDEAASEVQPPSFYGAEVRANGLIGWCLMAAM